VLSGTTTLTVTSVAFRSRSFARPRLPSGSRSAFPRHDRDAGFEGDRDGAVFVGAPDRWACGRQCVEREGGRM